MNVSDNLYYSFWRQTLVGSSVVIQPAPEVEASVSTLKKRFFFKIKSEIHKQQIHPVDIPFVISLFVHFFFI